LLRPFILILSVMLLAAPPSAIAQEQKEQGGILKTKDGRSFIYDSVQINGTTYLMKPHGLAPIEIAIADVLCVNQACDGLPEVSTAGSSGNVSIAGSNTIGASLMPALLRKLGESVPGGKVEVNFGQPDEQSLVLTSPGAQPMKVELAAHGSDTAFQGLLDGTAAIGMASRSIKPEEASAIKKKLKVNMLDRDSEHVIALDGLAVIVNKANPLKSFAFTTETLAQIFSGEISDWSQIGGKAGAITLRARDDKSGTYGTFKDLMLKPNNKTLALSAKRYESSDELSEAVANDESAIGFIGFPYIRDNEALAVGSKCGIVQWPTRFSVQSEVYPLARRLYLYTLGAPRDEATKTIVTYATSDAAQTVVREQGFIDQSIEFEDPQLKKNRLADLKQQADPSVPRNTYLELIKIAEGTRRASVSFRFNTGSAELDNKAVLDVARLARLLAQPEMTGKKWYLVGFADSGGAFAVNKDLSVQRAKSVARALRQNGVKATSDSILGYGWLSPVACNETAVGKQLNRRVEVWVAN
jgi:phosphate transport system substrate-binding protein